MQTTFDLKNIAFIDTVHIAIAVGSRQCFNETRISRKTNRKLQTKSKVRMFSIRFISIHSHLKS